MRLIRQELTSILECYMLLVWKRINQGKEEKKEMIETLNYTAQGYCYRPNYT
jgi:hypothetical protein